MKMERELAYNLKTQRSSKTSFEMDEDDYASDTTFLEFWMKNTKKVKKLVNVELKYYTVLRIDEAEPEELLCGRVPRPVLSRIALLQI